MVLIIILLLFIIIVIIPAIIIRLFFWMVMGILDQYSIGCTTNLLQLITITRVIIRVGDANFLNVR